MTLFYNEHINMKLFFDLMTLSFTFILAKVLAKMQQSSHFEVSL